MKEVALYDAKNNLSALVAEVEQSGEEIVITRHGKAAAKLSPVKPSARLTREQAIAGLSQLREEIAHQHPDAPVVSWETLKSWMRDEEDDE